MKTLVFVFCSILVAQASLALDGVLTPAQMESLRASADRHEAENNQELEAARIKVERLRTELDRAKGAGAQYWFKRSAQVCGSVAAISAVAILASGSERYGHYFGRSGDERAGAAFVGFLGVTITGPCAALAGILYSLTNDKVETLDALVQAAEVELEMLKKNKK